MDPYDEVEIFLSDRVAFRTSFVLTLGTWDKDVARVADWCEANDNGRTS
ncbi:hypothetical protein OH805_25640 [Streptomyces sp. NBC_00879]|nr:hypothetical protein OH805_25640 [Streptomyces sp. NBC_00879]